MSEKNGVDIHLRNLFSSTFTRYCLLSLMKTFQQCFLILFNMLYESVDEILRCEHSHACSKRSDSGERCEVKKAMILRTAPHYLNAWNRLNETYSAVLSQVLSIKLSTGSNGCLRMSVIPQIKSLQHYFCREFCYSQFYK